MGAGDATGNGGDAPVGGFSVVVDPESVFLQPGQQAEVGVTITRDDGFDGNVVVTLSDLPANVGSVPLSIASGETEGTLSLLATTDVEQGTTDVIVRGVFGNTVATDALSLEVGGLPGSPDLAYGEDGLGILPPPPDVGDLYSVVQFDGKVVVVATVFNDNLDFLVARFDETGAPDEGFGDGGYVVTDFGDVSNRATGVAVQDDGKIVVSGATGSPAMGAVVRYTEDGALDEDFGDGGLVETNVTINFYPSRVVVQPTGEIVAAFSCDGPVDDDICLVRLTTDGDPDDSFSTDGELALDFETNGDILGDLTLQGDKIVVAGATSERDLAVARLLSDGDPDDTFLGGDPLIYDLPGTDEQATAVIAIPDDKLVVAGIAHGAGRFVVQLDDDGAVDQDFGTDGWILDLLQGSETATYWASMVRQPNGQLLLAGMSTDGTNIWPFIGSFDADGSRDWLFGEGGLVTLDFDVPIAAIGQIGLVGEHRFAIGLQQYDADAPSSTATVFQGWL
jgi:uncharacterized delta-60 repeat protein